MDILEVDAKRRLRDFDEKRFLHHHLAHLLAFSYHDPGEMPEFRPSGEPEVKASEPRQATDAEIIQATGFFLALAMRPEG